jgi:hypothetical protein
MQFEPKCKSALTVLTANIANALTLTLLAMLAQ